MGVGGRKRTRALSDIDFLLSLSVVPRPLVSSVFACLLPFLVSPTVLCYTAPFSFKVTFCALIPSPALSAHSQGASLDGAERRKDS